MRQDQVIRVGIFVPNVFMLSEERRRKFTRILSNLQGFSVVVPIGQGGTIARFLERSALGTKAYECALTEMLDVTHAIVFYEGRHFGKAIEHFKRNHIPLRVIDIG